MDDTAILRKHLPPWPVPTPWVVIKSRCKYLRRRSREMQGPIWFHSSLTPFPRSNRILQFQRLKTDTAKLNRRTSNKLQSWVSDDPDIDLSVAFPSEGAQNGKWEERQTNRTTWKQHRTDSSDPYIPSLSHINDILMKAFAETSKAATMATT